MNPSLKNVAWILALLITFWLTWQASQKDEAVSAPTRLASTNVLAAKSSTKAPQEFELLPRTLQPSQVNLFAAPELAKAETAKRVFEKPAPLMAPPLPFKFMGRWQDDNQTKVLLNVAGEVVGIKEGDILNSQYQVVSITENAIGTQIQFLYMPLKQTQTMFIGKGNHE